MTRFYQFVGPMHEFVYGWQAIVNTMSMKNNVEVRKRAGLQRFALAGINGITLVSHIGVTEIMINGTRTYCFGGVSRPPGRRSVICKVAFLLPTSHYSGHLHCRDISDSDKLYVILFHVSSISTYLSIS